MEMSKDKMRTFHLFEAEEKQN